MQSCMVFANFRPVAEHEGISVAFIQDRIERRPLRAAVAKSCAAEHGQYAAAVLLDMLTHEGDAGQLAAEWGPPRRLFNTGMMSTGAMLSVRMQSASA